MLLFGIVEPCIRQGCCRWLARSKELLTYMSELQVVTEAADKGSGMKQSWYRRMVRGLA